MFKCPVCGNIMERIMYTKHGRQFHYLVCECGWTNKPNDLPEETEETQEA